MEIDKPKVLPKIFYDKVFGKVEPKTFDEIVESEAYDRSFYQEGISCREEFRQGFKSCAEFLKQNPLIIESVAELVEQLKKANKLIKKFDPDKNFVFDNDSDELSDEVVEYLKQSKKFRAALAKFGEKK